MSVPTRPVGELLREWRQRRRLSQLELSAQAAISTRHLSFVETGRSRPTAEMIIRLTEHLDVPLRERNAVLLAGGYAPAYSEAALDAPALGRIRSSLRQILLAHAPHPALLIDRWWTLLDANEAVAVLVDDCSAELLTPPVNVARLSLHPDGLAPRIVNLPQWRAHLLGQIRRRATDTADPRLRELDAELSAYPGGLVSEIGAPAVTGEVVLPMRLRVGTSELSLFSIAAAVETATDVTVQELTLEAFYPADEATSAWFAARHGSGTAQR